MPAPKCESHQDARDGWCGQRTLQLQRVRSSGGAPTPWVRWSVAAACKVTKGSGGAWATWCAAGVGPLARRGAHECRAVAHRFPVCLRELKPPQITNTANVDLWRASVTVRLELSKSACVPPSMATISPPVSRKAVYGRAAVASSQPLATSAGLQILQSGGNAFDAAIAVGAMLAVTEPCSNGIGGDFIALCDNNDDVTAVLGTGAAPAAITASLFPQQPVPLDCVHTITVPGTIAAWVDVKHRFGCSKLTLSDCLQPAIRAAKHGFPVAETTAYYWKNNEECLRAAKNGTDLLVRDGVGAQHRAPKAGELFVNGALASVLEEIAERGRDAFYAGRVGDAIIKTIKELGGVMSERDLAAHETLVTKPICTTYRGRTVYEPPPPTHGVVALMCLNVLDKFDMRELGEHDAWHVMIEAVRLSFAQASKRIADPAHTSDCSAELLKASLCEQLRKRIDMSRRCEIEQGAQLPRGGTVQFSVIDSHGNAVSAVQSNYCNFGTGHVPEGCGFTLQNRGLNFSLNAGDANCIAGGKRSYHTIIPALAKLGGWKAAIGVMGSFMQPQAHVQVLHSLLDRDMDAQQALDRRRFRVTGAFSGVEKGMCDDAVLVEEGFSEEAKSELARRGHDVRVGGLAQFGKGHICVRSANGVVMAGADNRADGVALAMV
eukprot:TRINITY_DN598_c0_g4_i1.p2 TRINITY_DN598_c0_g4~~TRINITY_DN598_c0_g4_i1.p2  ORF type:complete len:662 (-),score=108.01 TRINITY_DN598_c0_g4_i1:4414-6399(-)